MLSYYTVQYANLGFPTTRVLGKYEVLPVRNAGLGHLKTRVSCCLLMLQ